jgi:hypothetical protein
VYTCMQMKKMLSVETILRIGEGWWRRMWKGCIQVLYIVWTFVNANVPLPSTTIKVKNNKQ